MPFKQKGGDSSFAHKRQTCIDAAGIILFYHIGSCNSATKELELVKKLQNNCQQTVWAHHFGIAMLMGRFQVH